MSANLLKNVQEALAYPPLQKIDPNTQQMVVDANTPEEDKFSQAAIPAVLAGMYKYSQSDEGAEAILKDDHAETWMNRIFNTKMKEVVQSVASYSKQSSEDPVSKMEAIATETVKQVIAGLPAGAEMKDVKALFNNQSSDILLYLPAALNMGTLLNDNALDDQTNKMEGPLSGLMQSIGNAFSKPVMDDETKKS
jgi:hypothetical protein